MSLFLEDLAPGQKFVSDSLRVDAAAIKAFAEQFDPQPFHLDENAARSSFFGGLAASGWHTAAVTMRLLVKSGFVRDSIEVLPKPLENSGTTVQGPGARNAAPYTRLAFNVKGQAPLEGVVKRNLKRSTMLPFS